jgi:hypothetical protein
VPGILVSEVGAEELHPVSNVDTDIANIRNDANLRVGNIENIAFIVPELKTKLATVPLSDHGRYVRFRRIPSGLCCKPDRPETRAFQFRTSGFEVWLVF